MKLCHLEFWQAFCEWPGRWLVAAAALLGAGTANSVFAYTTNDVQTVFNAYSNVFFVRSGTNAWFRNQQGGSSATYFWGQANEIECVIDACEVSSNSAYARLITNLLYGFKYNNGSDWSYNSYNDDVMWACIAFARGYQATRNLGFRAIAKANFDMCYARGWDSTNGGLFWTTGNTNKVAAVNGPASIAAYLLYQCYGDGSYLVKASNVFWWERTNLFVAASGMVYDGMRVGGSPGGAATTYNQGTFIGAANFLGLTNDATLAADYTMNSMCSSGILPQYGTNNNNSGFNAIFLRWMSRFQRDRGWQENYRQWLQHNANAAWNYRRLTDNLSWCQWRLPTPMGPNLYSWDCLASLEALLVVPPTQTTLPGEVRLTASDGSGTSSYNQAGNWANGSAPSGSNTFIVDGLSLRTPADSTWHAFYGGTLKLTNGGALMLTTYGASAISVGTLLSVDNGLVLAATRPAWLNGRIRLEEGGGVLDPQSVGGFTVVASVEGPGGLVVASQTSTFGGTVTLACSNSYSGGTVINGPDTVQLTNQASLGLSSGSLTFAHNGEGLTIPFTAYGTANYGVLNLNGVSLSIGNLAGGGGRIVNNAAAGTAVLTLGNGSTGGGVFYGSILDHTTGGGAVSVVKTGDGSITLASTNLYTGGTTIAGGVLQLGDGRAACGVVTGSITNNAQMVFANPAAQLQSGAIRGSGAVSKLGAGTLVLSASNSYSGCTWIQAGTLALSGPGTIGLSSNISLCEGSVLDVRAKDDGTLLLAAGQALTGGGSVLGNLSVASGASLNVGMPNGSGSLTIQGQLSLAGEVSIAVNRTNQPAGSRVLCGGGIVAGGALLVTNAGPTPQAGDVLSLFSQPATGFSSLSLPALPSGLIWVNFLGRDGTLRVVSAQAFDPVRIDAAYASGSLRLSWPVTHLGWSLQAQTNGCEIGLGNQWVDLTGSSATNELNLSLDPNSASVFFRLVYR
jgi:autotransporter-associated beta strand protein